MKVKTLIRSWPVLLLASSLTLTLGCAHENGMRTAETQDPDPAAESWADQVEPGDERVLGTVASVRDDTFELKTYGDNDVYLFEIPSDVDQRADVRTGNEVQVWYDSEAFERDGDTYYRVNRIAMADREVAATESGLASDQQADLSASAELDAEQELASDTSTEQAEEYAQDELDEQNAQREQELAQSEPLEQTATAESQATDTRQEERYADDELRRDEFTDDQLTDDQFDEDQVADDQFADDQFADDRFDEDAQVLPQTAGTLPLVALGGLIALFGAIALRLYRS
ncbi:MAG TPA: hypothetical protein VMT85_23915 [Thermoanaerobaculia bacterium]|nr:hypothetical protein [Thermoanaerobaculia bacterium]